MNKQKLILPISIILGCIILGGFYYLVQINNQKSTERQKIYEIEENIKIEELKMEKENKEYASKRRMDCLKIYEAENNKWNNVNGWRYSEEDDICYIKYKDPKPKSAAECDEDWPFGKVGDFDWGSAFFRENSLCKSGEFENQF